MFREMDTDNLFHFLGYPKAVSSKHTVS